MGMVEAGSGRPQAPARLKAERRWQRGELGSPGDAGLPQSRQGVAGGSSFAACPSGELGSRAARRSHTGATLRTLRILSNPRAAVAALLAEVHTVAAAIASINGPATGCGGERHEHWTPQRNQHPVGDRRSDGPLKVPVQAALIIADHMPSRGRRPRTLCLMPLLPWTGQMGLMPSHIAESTASNPVRSQGSIAHDTDPLATKARCQQQECDRRSAPFERLSDELPADSFH